MPKMNMKRSSLIFFAVLMFVTSLAFANENTADHGSAKHKNLFTFKTDKKLVGAEVSVYYANGERLTTQKLLKKKMIIDFNDARMGTYTIVVKKGNNEKEFQFVKK